MYAPPSIFILTFLAVTLPMLVSEPYGRRTVGVTIDTGSSLLRMLFPTLFFAILMFLGLATVVYLVLQQLAKFPVLVAAYENFFPAGIVPSDHLIQSKSYNQMAA